MTIEVDPPAASITLETERLVIRQFVEGDWRAVHDYRSDPDVTRFLERGPFAENDAKAFVARNSGSEPREHVLLLRDSGELIGHMPFRPWFGTRTWEIGWVLGRPHHGRGYATEAARALLEYGFDTLGLHRVIATCDPRNAASIRVMEKLGMRREAHFVKCFSPDGETWRDEYHYAILGEEWARTATA